MLRQGNGQRIISFDPSKETSGVLLSTPTLVVGDLLLECLPAGEEWRIDFSDTPISRAQAA